MVPDLLAVSGTDMLSLVPVLRSPLASPLTFVEGPDPVSRVNHPVDHRVDHPADHRALPPLRLIVGMALSVAVVAGLAYWDSARESTAALRDFAEEQVTLAKALAVALAHQHTGDTSLDVGAIADGLAVGRRGDTLAVLVGASGGDRWRTVRGRTVISPALAAASARGDAVLRVARDDAPAFGLPRRTALAGLARTDGGLTIVAVASAERERDRERWAVRRLILSVVLAASLVLVFGGLAVRKQRAELTLGHQLAIADLAQQRDERLQRASKAAALGTLAMGVAHELSTPLGVIGLRAEQIQARAGAGADDRTGAAAATILAQTERMRQIIRGLLGLARGDAPVADRVEPRALIDQAIGLVAHRFEKAEVRLSRRVEDALPDVVGDPRLLEHAVVNLLLNACDASPRGGTVTVSAAREGAGVVLRVDDEGSGISPTDADRVMEPFFTTKPRGAGTGLGLALANEIVNSHRGTLTLAARAPGGTSAVIHLPPAEHQGHD